MKQTRWNVFFIALGLVVALGAFVSRAEAQNLPNTVVIVDVAQLIKSHPEFKMKQESLQKEMLAEEAKFRARQEEVGKKEASMKNSPYKAGSPEYQSKLDEIAGDYADFEKDARAMQRRFALKNSQIMFDTFQDIRRTIESFAMQNKIAQVTDYRIFEPNPADPQTVAEDMEQNVVWFNPQLDVTKHIVQHMYALRNAKPPQDVMDALVTVQDIQQKMKQGSGGQVARPQPQPQPGAPAARTANPPQPHQPLR